MTAPWLSKTVVNGMFSRVCGKLPPESKMKSVGFRPADTRFPSAITSPQANAVTGAKIGPTEATLGCEQRGVEISPDAEGVVNATIESGS